MVILQINSNIPQDDKSFADFSAKATEVLARTLNKNSSFIQVIYTDAKVAFGNQNIPSSLVTLTSADLLDDDIATLLPILSKLLERLIGSPPPTTYIRFERMNRAQTAWTGRSLYH